MLPRETTVRQLKKLRAETKGKDIGDLTSGDRLNHNIPNLQYIGNPVDSGIESWEDFSKKDSKLQTIAFKSKLVNKPLVKENNKINMKNIIKLENFETDIDDRIPMSDYKEPDYEERDIEPSFYEEYGDDTIFNFDKYNDENIDDDDDESTNDDEEFANDELINDEVDDLNDLDDDKVISFREYHSPSYRPTLLDRPKLDDEEGLDLEYIEKKKREKNVEINKYDEFDDEDDFYGNRVDDERGEPTGEKKNEAKEEKEEKGFPYGYAQQRDMEIKKIANFNNWSTIDPPTPKERPILNAGRFIENDKIKGYVNRIEGKDIYIESIDEPMTIKKFNIKDAIKNSTKEKN